MGLVALVVNSYMLFETVKSYKYVDLLDKFHKLPEDGDMVILARQHVRIQVGLCIISVAIIAMSLAAGLVAPVSSSVPISSLQIINTVGFSIICTVVVIMSIGIAVVHREIVD